MLPILLALALAGFVVSLLGTAAARRWAPRFGLVDQPAARKVHRRPTPLGGGVALWLGVVLPVAGVYGAALVIGGQETRDERRETRDGGVRSDRLQAVPRPAEAGHYEQSRRSALDSLRRHVPGLLSRGGQVVVVLAAGTLMMLMGLLDDVRNLPWLPRLVMQVVVATGLVLAGVRLTIFLEHAWLSGVVTVGWLVVMTNAFNWLDNMDGLSGGIGLIASVLMAVVMLSGAGEPQLFVGGFLLLLGGALAGFLVFNFPPASVFMGDAGSNFLGLMIGTSAVLGTFYESGTYRHAVIAPLCVLAVPLYDFVSVLAIRLRQGRSPFHPDKSHFSHRLVERGLSPRYAVYTIYLVTLGTGLGALVLYQVEWSGALVVLGMVLSMLGVIAILESTGRSKQETPVAPASRAGAAKDSGEAAGAARPAGSTEDRGAPLGPARQAGPTASAAPEDEP